MDITLQIYKTSSGQWAGIMLRDGVEIGRIAGCSSRFEVIKTATEQGFYLEFVETV